MKVTLEYNSEEDDQKDEAKLALVARDMQLSLVCFDEWLRSEIKYHNKNEYQEARDELHRTAEAYQIEWVWDL